MNAPKPFALGSIAIAAVFHLTSVHADPVRDSFERDLNRVATQVNATAAMPMTDALQRAFNTATWTQPGQRAQRSDPRRASAHVGRPVPVEARDRLAQLASH